MQYKLISEVNENMSALEQVLTNRGIKYDDIEHFIKTNKYDLLNPLLLENMKKGAQLLLKHISQNNKIYIQVDPDADGFTSSSILINYLNCLFPHFVQTKVFYDVHTDKHHSIQIDSIPKDVKLVIAPDCSSNEHEVHYELAKKGIDVLVLDHHQSEKDEHETACIINNQMCDYPTKSLSGAGIVYKFCSYLDNLLGEDFAKDYLDLASVGIVSDVMDLRSFEVQKILKEGCSNVRNPFLKGFVEKNEYSFQKGFNPYTISWYIAPAINAITRVGTKEENLLLFESMIEFLSYRTIPSTKKGESGKFETRVEQAIRTCTNVKNRQKKFVDNAYENILELIERKHLDNNQVLFITLDSSYNINHNLSGLIANKLMSEYKRPTLVLFETEDYLNEEDENKSIFYRGSGRGYGSEESNSFKNTLNESGFMDYAEGHNQAFGASFLKENYDKLVSYTNDFYKDLNLDNIYNVDFIIDGQSNFSLKDSLSELVDFKYLWGKGLEEPYIAIENLPLTPEQVHLYGKGFRSVLNITLPNGESLVKFRPSEEEYNNLIYDSGRVYINAVGTIDRTNWGCQIVLEDYEIISKGFYF